tara:strand:+ start:1123 stop:1338 length:216 start_codon:yes stop_codon:yes gene_type:complete
MLNIKIMTTLLNETTKINELKLNIGLLELDLEKFMEMDLSNSETRNEMRIVLNKISNLENKLSLFVNSIKL